MGIKNAQVRINPTNLDVETESLDVTVEVSFADNSLFVPKFMGPEPFLRTCSLIRENTD